jgi:hypothetical protein
MEELLIVASARSASDLGAVTCRTMSLISRDRFSNAASHPGYIEYHSDCQSPNQATYSGTVASLNSAPKDGNQVMRIKHAIFSQCEKGYQWLVLAAGCVTLTILIQSVVYLVFDIELAPASTSSGNYPQCRH